MQAVMMWPLADFVEGIFALLRWFTSCWRGRSDQSHKPNPEPEADAGQCPAVTPTKGMCQHDCYGITKRLGCEHPGFCAYDRERDGQWVWFSPKLEEAHVVNEIPAHVCIWVCYRHDTPAALELRVRQALQVQLQHEIELRQQFLAKWPALTRTAMRTNGCTRQDPMDIAEELGCRLDVCWEHHDAWLLEFTPKLGETMKTAGRTAGARFRAFHALTPAALERKTRNGLRNQVNHEIELRQQALAKL